MNRLAAATSWLIVGTGLLLAFAYPSEASEKELQGTWTATKAEQDGKSDSAIVGHRLSFTGNRFQIQSKDSLGLRCGPGPLQFLLRCLGRIREGEKQPGPNDQPGRRRVQPVHTASPFDSS